MKVNEDYMRTVYVQLVKLNPYAFCRVGTFKKVAADYLHEVGLMEVQRRRKPFGVHLSCLAVGLIQHILLIDAK